MKEYKSIRVFKSPVLEAMTHVHPIVPLLLWVPVITFWLYKSHVVYSLSPIEYVGSFIMGILIWTLTEYVLHRFVFHMPTIGPITKRFVWLFHGLHHDDPTRLVMPPVPAILIVSILYALFSIVVPVKFMMAFMAFFIVGLAGCDGSIARVTPPRAIVVGHTVHDGFSGLNYTQFVTCTIRNVGGHGPVRVEATIYDSSGQHNKTTIVNVASGEQRRVDFSFPEVSFFSSGGRYRCSSS